MGATLPAMERVTAQMRTEGRSIAALYASNTFGAVIGVLAIAFWLVPELGLGRAPRVSASPSMFSARCIAGLVSAGLADSARSGVAEILSARRGVLARLAFTGLLGIGYEVLVVRVLSQVAEDTVYTFAMLLAVYLVGSAAGAAGYQRWLARTGLQTRSGSAGRSVAVRAGRWPASSARQVCGAAEHVKMLALQSIRHQHDRGASPPKRCSRSSRSGRPPFVMGALFSHLSACANASGISFGRALGVNTLGAAAAPLRVRRARVSGCSDPSCRCC